MQDLIEKVEHAISYNVEGGLVEKYTWTELFDDMEKALEKEKEQIKNDFTNGQLFPSLKFEEYFKNEYQKNK